MEQDKEQYAKALANRAEKAVKILKVLVIVALAIAVGLLIFSIVALTVIKDSETGVIGLAVFMSCISALLIAIASIFVFTLLTLNKLKKLK